MPCKYAGPGSWRQTQSAEVRLGPSSLSLSSLSLCLSLSIYISSPKAALPPSGRRFHIQAATSPCGRRAGAKRSWKARWPPARSQRRTRSTPLCLWRSSGEAVRQATLWLHVWSAIIILIQNWTGRCCCCALWGWLCPFFCSFSITN